jgi:hypothetical protein
VSQTRSNCTTTGTHRIHQRCSCATADSMTRSSTACCAREMATPHNTRNTPHLRSQQHAPVELAHHLVKLCVRDD